MSTVVMLPLLGTPRPAAVPAATTAPGLERAYAAPAPLVMIRRARPADLPAMMELLDHYARRGLLLHRSPKQVRRQLGDFVVAVDAMGVVGCAGLRRYSPQLAEIVGVAVAEHCHGQGVGRHLIDALLDEARALGLRRVFALTLQDGFFHRLGFRTTRVAEFPEKIALDCSGCLKRATCAEIAVAIELNS